MVPSVNKLDDGIDDRTNSANSGNKAPLLFGSFDVFQMDLATLSIQKYGCTASEPDDILMKMGKLSNLSHSLLRHYQTLS